MTFSQTSRVSKLKSCQWEAERRDRQTKLDLPSKTDTAAVAHGVPKDLAGDDVEGIEDLDEHLPSVSWQRKHETVNSGTHVLIDVLGKVGDVQVGGALVTLGLETGVEALLRARRSRQRYLK